MPAHVNNLVGQRFGRLVVLHRSTAPGEGAIRWACLCDCGKHADVQGDNLKSGHVRSCGCLAIETQTVIRKHGHARSGAPSAEYSAWTALKNRCTNPRNKDYRKYGGRGITFSTLWLSFEKFLSDVGRRPSRKHSLDRINVNGNYEPGNVRWATKKQQARNRRKPSECSEIWGHSGC